MANNFTKLFQGVSLDGLSTEPTGPLDGDFYYNTSESRFKFYENGAWKNLGGSGGINFILNPDFESGTEGWSVYGNASPTDRPETGTGGSIVGTGFSALQNDDFGFNSYAYFSSDSIGHGLSYDFLIRRADQARSIQISFDYATDLNVLDGNYTVWVYDITNSRLITVTPFALDATGTVDNSASFVGEFQTSPDSVNYRLCIHKSTDGPSNSSDGLRLVNFRVGPVNKSFSAPLSDWEENTAVSNWSGTQEMRSRRVGDSLELMYQLTLDGAPSGTFYVELPNGLVADLTKVAIETTESTSLGIAVLLDEGTVANRDVARVSVSSSNPERLVLFPRASAGGVAATVPFTWAAMDRVMIKATIPIVGWSSSLQTSVDLGTRSVYGKAYLSTTQGINDNTSTTLNIDTSVRDTHGLFDVASDGFIIKESGFYSLLAQVSFDGDATGHRRLLIRVNGSAIVNQQTAVNDAANTRISASTVEYLEVGDVVSLNALQTSGGSLDVLSGEANTFLSISLEKNGKHFQASERVAAIYTGAATVIGTSNATVIFPNRVLDTHNAYNPSTGEFTVPVSGLYEMGAITRSSGTASSSAANRSTTMDVDKNGTPMRAGEFRYQVSGTAMTVWILSTPVMVECVAGDVLTIAQARDADIGAYTLSGSDAQNRVYVKKL